MTPAQESARRLLETTIPDNVRESMAAEYGLHLHPGATYKEMLDARMLQLAEAGDPQAREMVQRYGGLD